MSKGTARNTHILDHLSRRNLLKGSAAFGAAAGLSSLPTITSAQDAPSGVLQIGGESETSGVWLPFRAGGGAETQVFDLVYSRLIRFDADYNLIPDLAAEYSVNEDASEFTFNLRDNVTWHDGTPFTAKDVIFTYKLAINGEVGSSQYNKLRLIKGAVAYHDGEADDVEGLQAPDDYTVVITLESPNIAFLIGAAHNNSLVWILPEHIFADAVPAEIDQHPYALSPTVGTGPFIFQEYVPDQYISTSVNTNYFLGSPKIEQVFVRTGTPATQLAQLESGELHIMQEMTARDGERLATSDVVNIVPTPGVGIFQTAIHNERYADNRIRQAFMYAVDRAALMEVVLRGQGRLVHSAIIGPEWAQYDDLNDYAYDPERAKELLAEAGWDPDHELTLIYLQGTQAVELCAPVVQQQFGEAGIKLVLSPLEEEAFVGLLNDMDYDLAWFGGGAYGLDPDVSATYYACANWRPGGANTTHYCSEELDALYAAGRSTSDVAERTEIYHEAALILNEDVPTIFWWSENMIWGISKKLEGVLPGANTDIHWNVHEWSLSE